MSGKVGKSKGPSHHAAPHERGSGVASRNRASARNGNSIVGLQHDAGNRATHALITEAARLGMSGPVGALPFLAQIQASFGNHGVSHIRAHLDASASRGAAMIGAAAFTTGHHVVFARQPSLFTAAHEAAHVIQQRAGVRPEDRHETHADAVAMRVVQGLSSEDLLDAYTASAAVSSSGVVQCEHEGDWETFGKSADLSELLPNAHKLRNGALKLFTIGNKLKKQGTHLFGDDKAKLASAYNILDLAKALTDLAQGVEGIAGASGGLKMAGKTATHLRNLTAAIKLAADLFDDEKSQSFEADPTNFDKAAAWATQAADTFGDAGKLIDVIPDGLLPGFVKEFWKGLLRAPASYVKAFLSIMTSHIARIDAASGARAKESVTHGVGGDWEGPLSMVYFRAPAELREFMQSHRKRSGLDLFKAPESVGKGQLLAMIESEADPAMKARWISIVEGEPERK